MCEYILTFLKIQYRSQSDSPVNLKSLNTYNFQAYIQKSITKLTVKVLDL